MRPGLILWLASLVVPALYIFISGGINFETVFLYLGFVIANMGMMAIYGGAPKKQGIIVIVVGVGLATLAQWV